jgi:hypothetical protein
MRFLAGSLMVTEFAEALPVPYTPACRNPAHD